VAKITQNTAPLTESLKVNLSKSVTFFLKGDSFFQYCCIVIFSNDLLVMSFNKNWFSGAFSLYVVAWHLIDLLSIFRLFVFSFVHAVD